MQGKKQTVLIWEVLLVVVVIGGVFWYVNQGKSANNPSQANVAPVVSSLLSGNKQDAMQQASQYLAANPQSAIASRIYADESFDMAITSADKIKAVQTMIQNYDNAKLPAEQASEINSIAMGLALSPQSGDMKDVSDAVFSSKEFKSYAVQDAPGKSLQKLLTYSISLYPLPEAYYIRAFLVAKALETMLVPGKARLVDTSAQSQANAKAQVAQIVQFLQSGDKIVQQNTVSTGNPDIDALIKSRNDLIRGFSFGVASVIDASYLPSAVSAFNDVEKGASDNGSGMADLNAAYAKLYTARAEYLVGGDSQTANVRSELSSFVSTISASPAKYQDIYTMLDWVKGAANTPSAQQSGSGRYQMYATYSALAGVSPEFKSFLLNNGWTL